MDSIHLFYWLWISAIVIWGIPIVVCSGYSVREQLGLRVPPTPPWVSDISWKAWLRAPYDCVRWLHNHGD